MSFAEHLGARIRFYRKQKKLSQEKLAELCSLHPSYIGQIERGEKNITVDILHRLSIGLEISMAELLQDVDITDSTGAQTLSDVLKALLLLSNGDLKRIKRLLDAILELVE